MTFELLPVIGLMLELYRQPLDFNRFKSYISLLTGDTQDDLVLPIGGFNPMAKAHTVQQLQALKQLDAEGIMRDVLHKLDLPGGAPVFNVALTLADDLQGGWTNRYTTDYQSRFRNSALVKRHFCLPYFWTSEPYDEKLVRTRTLEAVYRTLYQLDHAEPSTLEEHVLQEKAVFAKVPGNTAVNDLPQLETFYQKHLHNSGYPLIFNFLYGDDAAETLGYTPCGIAQPMAGFAFAQHISLY